MAGLAAGEFPATQEHNFRNRVHGSPGSPSLRFGRPGDDEI